MAQAARVGDVVSKCKKGKPPTPIISGSGNVFINGKPAARKGDPAAPHPHPRLISSGSGSVFINGKPAARKGDSNCFASKITQGSSNVFFG